jgi:hypothetical protein
VPAGVNQLKSPDLERFHNYYALANVMRGGFFLRNYAARAGRSPSLLALHFNMRKRFMEIHDRPMIESAHAASFESLNDLDYNGGQWQRYTGLAAGFESVARSC